MFAANNIIMKNFKYYLKLAAIGLCGGAVNGFLGSGGGIIVLFGILKLKKDRVKAHASCLLAIVPMSVVSACVYIYKSKEGFFDFIPIIISGGVGGIIGAKLLSKINKTVLGIVFTGIIIFSGVRMLLS